MKKIKTLKKNYEFQNVLKKGKFYVGKQIIVYILSNKNEQNSIGIAVSSKEFNAVQRNKIKRKIRENYRLIKNKLKPGNNIVLLWNKKNRGDSVDFHLIKKDMENIFTKAGILEK